MPTKPFGLDLTNLESSHRANFNKVEEAAICDFMASPPFDDFANKYNVTLWMMEKYQLDIDDLLEKLGCGDLARKVNNKKQEVLPMIKKKVYRKIYNLHRENDVYGDPVKKESTHEDTLAKQSSESTQATDMSSSAVIVKYQPSSRSKISGGLAPAFVVSSGPGVMGETAETTLTSSKDKSKSVAKSKARAESVDIGEEDSSRSSRAKRVSTAPITSHTRTAASASPSAKAAAMIKRYVSPPQLSLLDMSFRRSSTVSLLVQAYVAPIDQFVH